MTDDFNALGAQTATVYRRRRVKAQDYRDDGHTAWTGCLLVPMSSDEQTAQGLTVARRWRLAAPPGFTARAQDQVEVTPGPQTDDGRPLRLGLDGYASPAHDFDGSTNHVEAVLIARDA